MKRLLTILLSIAASHTAISQTFPYGINYQTVARDANGNAVIGQTIVVKFSIYKTAATGQPEWQEEHVGILTNNLGQFNVVIGNGATTNVGSVTPYSAINWGADIHFLKVEVGNATGNNYAVFGIPAQFQSVPYALNAKTVDFKYAVFQELYSPGTCPVYNSLLPNTWMDITLNNVATISNSSDISISGTNITLNAGTDKISDFANYDFYNGGSNAGASFLTKTIVTSPIPNSSLILGSSSSLNIVSGRSIMSLNSNIEGIVTISANGTILKFQRMQVATGAGATPAGIPPVTTFDRVLS